MSSNFTGLEFKNPQNTDFLFLSCFLDQSFDVKMSKSKKKEKINKKING